MRLSILGAGRHTLLRPAWHHYMEVLFRDGDADLLPGLDVEVRVHDVGSWLGSAVALYDDDDCLPLDFEVELSSTSSPSERLLGLAHEAVHVRQLATGQLIDRGGNVVWMGKRYPKDTPYGDRPWEQEALMLEAPLARGAALRYGWGRVESRTPRVFE